jgi:hypothetical protein
MASLFFLAIYTCIILKEAGCFRIKMRGQVLNTMLLFSRNEYKDYNEEITGAPEDLKNNSSIVER